MSVDRRPTVLVVEDQPLIRLVAVELIEDAGWNAIEAADAADALTALSAHPYVSVLFTDINMPGMDGLELARRVHELYPGIELVITSGKRALADIDLPDDGTFLAKPYDPDRLISVISSKLN